MSVKNRLIASVAFATALLAGAAIPLGGAQAFSFFENFNSTAFEGASFTSGNGDNNNEKYADPTIQFYTAANSGVWTFSNTDNPGATFFQAFDKTGSFSDGAILLNENGPGWAKAALTGLTPGVQATVSWLLYGDNRPGGEYGLNVTVDSSSIWNFSGFVIGPAGANSGTLETAFFTPTSSSVILMFQQINSVGEGSPIIDDVSVSQTPLPSTWLMLLSGFVGLGFFAYRGTKNRSAALAA